MLRESLRNLARGAGGGRGARGLGCDFTSDKPNNSAKENESFTPISKLRATNGNIKINIL